MGNVVAGFARSHAPSIAHVYDHGKTAEEGWRPLLDGIKEGWTWLMAQEPDALGLGSVEEGKPRTSDDRSVAKIFRDIETAAHGKRTPLVDSPTGGLVFPKPRAFPPLPMAGTAPSAHVERTGE